MKVRKLAPLVALVSALVIVSMVLVNTKGQEEYKPGDGSVIEQWEYLAVAGPGSTNFSPTGNPRMRKEPNVPFGREAFVLEQHLDKLGANGWELITVAGQPTDPVYYFKKRKQSESSR